MNESTPWSSVGVVRIGNLMEYLSVTCVYKEITASFSANINGPKDVVIALIAPEVINFKPGQNRSSKSLFSANSSVFKRFFFFFYSLSIWNH